MAMVVLQVLGTPYLTPIDKLSVVSPELAHEEIRDFGGPVMGDDHVNFAVATSLHRVIPEQ
jgi:hypothetical protein